MIVAYIDEHRERFGVEPICQVLTQAGTKIAPSTYHAAKTRPPSARTLSDASSTALIAKVHRENYSVYSARKIHAELQRPGHPIARSTMQRLIASPGCAGSPRRRTLAPRSLAPVMTPVRTWSTGPSGPQHRTSRWVADITYCRTFAGWVYAACVIDVFSRRVVDWQLSTSLRTDLALDVLEMGLWSKQHHDRDTSGLIHQSDKGLGSLCDRDVLRRCDDAGSASGQP